MGVLLRASRLELRFPTVNCDSITMLLVILSIYVLLCGWISLKRAVFPEAGRWVFFASVASALWLLAYAGIWFAIGAERVDLLLWSGRLAFLGPMLGHAAGLFMFRVLATGDRPPRSQVMVLLLASAATHLPAIFTDLTIRSVSLENGVEKWHYGPLWWLPMAFHNPLILYEIYWLARRWTSIDWAARNRILIELTALFGAMFIGMVTNQFLPMLAGDNRYLFSGPALMAVPVTVFTWSVVTHRLPDVFGAAGRIIPNSRSRLLEELSRLEARVVEGLSADAFMERLSELAGSPVRIAWAGAAPGGLVKGLVQLTPDGLQRFYAPGDRRRLQEIVDRLVPSPGALAGNLPVVMTGWGPESRILEPKDSLWPTVSPSALSAADAVARALQTGTGCIVIAQDTPQILFAQARLVAGREQFFETTYPADREEDGDAGRHLLINVHDPSSTLVWVWVHSSEVRPEFEFALGALVHDGAKVIVLASKVGRGAFGPGKLLGSPEFGGVELPVIEVEDLLARPEGISILVDQHLTELEAVYRLEFSITPETREVLCGRQWTGGETELQAEVERLVLQKAGVPSGSRA